MIALILTGGVAAILEDDFGRSMRTQITGAISQLEITKDETNKIGKFLQATVAKLDY